MEKPAGILSHPNKSGEENRSLIQARYDAKAQCYLSEAGEKGVLRIWLLHRLDGATSGVILVAADETVAQAVKAAFVGRTVTKVYTAIVLGHAREKLALWRDRLQARREAATVRAEERGSAWAETSVRLLRLIPGPPALSALELEPHTGRTHQLRFQCARRKLPILGDQNYGNFRANRELARRFGTNRLFLHARRVELNCALPGGRRVHFQAEAPLPEEFGVFLGP